MKTKLEEPKKKAADFTEDNGVITLHVVSDGTTGEQWIARLEGKGFRLSSYAKDVLRSPDFKPTEGVETEIAILKGSLFEDSERITRNIRKEAANRGYSAPNAEVACLIREQLSDADIEAMGLWWITAMHDPIKDSDRDPVLLSADRNVEGQWLSAYCDGPGSGWSAGFGFAFAVSVSQVSAVKSGTDTSSETLSLELRVQKLEALIEGIRSLPCGNGSGK